MRRLAIIAAFLGLALSARADQGELLLSFSQTPSWSWVTAPLDTNKSQANGFGMPLEVLVRYGLSNSWGLGIGFNTSFNFSEMLTEKAKVDKVSGSLSFGYLDLTVPLVLSYRIDNGYDHSTVIEARGGFSSTRYSHNFLESEGFTALTQEELASGWKHGGMAGLGIMWQGRFLEGLIVEAGPQFDARYTAGWSFNAGLMMRVSWALGMGSPFRSRNPREAYWEHLSLKPNKTSLIKNLWQL